MRGEGSNFIVELAIGVPICIAPIVPPLMALKGDIFIEYSLTSKSKDTKDKLDGLQLFLKDYSDMKNKDLNELELWDEYMVYSVVLNDNKKVQKEVLRILKNYLKQSVKS